MDNFLDKFIVIVLQFSFPFYNLYLTFYKYGACFHFLKHIKFLISNVYSHCSQDKYEKVFVPGGRKKNFVDVDVKFTNPTRRGGRGRGSLAVFQHIYHVVEGRSILRLDKTKLLFKFSSFLILRNMWVVENFFDWVDSATICPALYLP